MIWADISFFIKNEDEEYKNDDIRFDFSQLNRKKGWKAEEWYLENGFDQGVFTLPNQDCIFILSPNVIKYHKGRYSHSSQNSLFSLVYEAYNNAKFILKDKKIIMSPNIHISFEESNKTYKLPKGLLNSIKNVGKRYFEDYKMNILDNEQTKLRVHLMPAFKKTLDDYFTNLKDRK